ncbi:MAG TPA: AI-2E family transporter [Acetobacteraceae bacterium]|nr:AI-2E family transporter [Acetobacteraceae bacterium]
MVLVAGLTLAAWRLADVAVLLFAAVLMAVGLRAGSSGLTRVTGLDDTVGLGVVVLLFVAVFGVAFWFLGTVVADQSDELVQQVPAGLTVAISRLQAHPYGRYALEQARGIDAAGATGWAASTLAVFARALARGLGYAILAFFVAIYLSAQPLRYRRLCIRLVPPGTRVWVERLFDEAASNLRRWLLGQLIVMATVGTLSGLGLWALGIEAPVALGLLGGLLTFIPYVGAVLAAVPATLIALTQGPQYAVWVLLMYVAVHVVEGNFITPLVQEEATSLPPVVSLLSTVAFSILFGPSAVLLAAPLTLFLMVAVEVLYVEQVLGEPSALPGVHTTDPVR